ncbi:MAG: site-specific integrase [Eubacteriales bacterium]|nr:site-specific integrase [Eubacteriales bacterium]
MLDDLIEQTSSCMIRVLKLSPRTVYGQSYGYMKAIQDYCLNHGEKYYNPVLLRKVWEETEARYERGEISQSHYLGKRKCLERLVEYYNTGTLSWTMHKLKQKYRLFDEYKALLEEFLQMLVRDPNTIYDYSWVIRRYLNYLQSIGITDVWKKSSDLAGFILYCSKEVTRGSLRTILSYAKRFHEFLRGTGRLDIPFEGRMQHNTIWKT